MAIWAVGLDFQMGNLDFNRQNTKRFSHRIMAKLGTFCGSQSRHLCRSNELLPQDPGALFQLLSPFGRQCARSDNPLNPQQTEKVDSRSALADELNTVGVHTWRPVGNGGEPQASFADGRAHRRRVDRSGNRSLW